jgi:hypothetical protein
LKKKKKKKKKEEEEENCSCIKEIGNVLNILVGKTKRVRPF